MPALAHADSAEAEAHVERVLVFLPGSLGDTLVALPALHLIARRFPKAERRALTDIGKSEKAVPMASLLEGTGLIQDYYWFPGPSVGTYRFRPLIALAGEIRRWKPQVLVYLHEQRGRLIALRDAAIFRALGIRRLIGVPVTRELQRKVFQETTGRFEHRSEYLARSLATLGESRLMRRASWDLAFSAAERARARAEIGRLGTCPGILAMSIGTKIPVNDWGDDNWRTLLDALSHRLPGWGLIALGAAVEHGRSALLLAAWRGPSLNLAGKVSVRESGAVLERARVYIGHDSGPMHLAAAVGTPCAAIFSARNPPGLWFPHGPHHTVFYHKTDCAGCRLNVCVEFKKKCITAISVASVSAAVLSMLSTARAPGELQPDQVIPASA
jgi:ADP-heptose:LPS heptosyltransferase